MKTFLALLSAALIIPATTRPTSAAGEASATETAIARVRAVMGEGKGNAEAASALKELTSHDASSLLSLLQAMDGANDLSANWLRSAIETLAQREGSGGKELPLAALGGFLFDTRHDPRARRLAYDLIAQKNAATATSLLPGMLNDPSLELRRDAVQQVIDNAVKTQSSQNNLAATLLYQQAMGFARDIDQIETISAALKTLGHPADLPTLFGWVREWKVIGPFDNTKRAGFDQVYPPEQELNLNAEYPGKAEKVRWKELTSVDDYGKVDVNQPLGKLKETIAYCYTELRVDKAQSAEIRLGCKNAWKVWLNGKLLFGRDEYHRGAEIDQYRMPVELQAGKNALLVKLGQNEQVEDWTTEWEFQLRVTDSLGTPIRPLRVGVPLPSTARVN